MSTNDIAGLGLKEPEQVDWNNYNPQSNFQAPPPAIGPDGKPVVYYGQAPKEFTFDATKENAQGEGGGLLEVLIDPIVIVKSGPADGYTLRFTRASVRKFKKGDKEINASMLGNYLQACGSNAKPQKNSEYVAAVKQTAGKVFPFILDWSAYNKDTGERVDGYMNFPEDPERPGQRKAILKAGDKYRDKNGQEQTVQSDVLFANARLRYFKNPNKK